MKEPQLAFRVARTPLPHAVGLVDRGLDYDSACSGASPVMGVDVVDVDDRHAGRRAQALRRLVVVGRRVQPDDVVTGADLGVYTPAVIVAVQRAGCEPEDPNQVLMSRGEVVIDQ